MNDPGVCWWLQMSSADTLIGSRTLRFLTEMLLIFIYMPNMSNPVFLSASCVGVVTSAMWNEDNSVSVMDSQEFLAGLPFWSFGEKEAGKRNGLVGKSSTWIKLLVHVDSKWFFYCVPGILPSCPCLHPLWFVTERHSSLWSAFGKWVTWSRALL